MTGLKFSRFVPDNNRQSWETNKHSFVLERILIRIQIGVYHHRIPIIKFEVVNGFEIDFDSPIEKKSLLTDQKVVGFPAVGKEWRGQPPLPYYKRGP